MEKMNRCRPRGNPICAVAMESLENRVLFATVPAGFTDSTFVSGLSNPTAMAFAPDGRLFVAEQGGNLRVVQPTGALNPTPFLHVNTDSNGERGLIGVVLDPNFQANHFVYVYYTVPGGATSPHNRVSRFTANGDVVAAGSEVPLVDLDPLSSATNHNGGSLHFGTDGKLYIGVGENANGANAQTLSNRLGKMLRINPDGSIPTDNPFYNTATGANRAIWALGLRNPYTFAVQEETGRIFINDVGQSTWEEIDDGMAGANYGWPSTEGAFTQSQHPNFTEPFYTYPHGGNVLAITGGTFYPQQSPQFPAQYAGTYFFSDLGTGIIYSINPTTKAVSNFASGIGAPVDLDVGSDGSLYYLSHNGTVGRIQAIPLGHVMDRHIFYNNSSFDGNDPAANAADTLAIAPDKEALSPGEHATFANYTSYSKGINGIMIDLDGGRVPVLSDFTFRVGNSSDLSTWHAAPAPSAITSLPTPFGNTSLRIALTWPDNAIENEWLEVTIGRYGPGPISGDRFYFGNAIADSGAGNTANYALVNATDEIAARNDPHNFANPAPIDNVHDYDRDGKVDATDQILARTHGTNFLTALRFITPPPPPVEVARFTALAARDRARVG